MLVAQVWGPKFDPPRTSVKKSGVVVHTDGLRAGDWEGQADPCGSVASQPSLIRGQ